MADSYISEKVFRALTGPKFETLFLSSHCLSIGETDAIFALSGKTPLEILLFIASGNEKALQQLFQSVWRNFIRFCRLFVVRILKKLINFRSGYTITLKLFYSLRIVKIFPYLKYARMITIMLHYFVNDNVIFQWMDVQNKVTRFFVPTIFSLYNIYSGH